MDQEVAKSLGELELKLQELERELTSIGRDTSAKPPHTPPHTPATSSHAPPEPPDTPVEPPHPQVERSHTPPEPQRTLVTPPHTLATPAHTLATPAHTLATPPHPQGTPPHTQAESPHATGRLIDEAAGGEIDVAQHPGARMPVDREAFGGPAIFGGEEVPAQPGATAERSWTAEARETAYGEIPTPPSLPHTSNPLGGSSPAGHATVDVVALARFRDKLADTMNELIDECDRLLHPESLSRQ